ncbi:MAG: hypothetical protein V2I67_07220 [Thermoanaerobaculales bacterium]|jgi:hypothetical protein|nr:hypothetical protein [Thermoanaerobaculales bacterium]
MIVAVLASTPTAAGNFSSAYQACLDAFKEQPASTSYCAPETCGFRACISDHSLSLHYGDIVVSGGRLTSIPAECKPHQDVMNRCIIEHINSAIPQPTPTPQDVSGSWKIFQSNGYKGTLNFTQDPNGQITGSASFNKGLSGTLTGTVTGQQITFEISYPSGIKGAYNGVIASNGRTIRSANTRSSTGESATWEASRF